MMYQGLFKNILLLVYNYDKIKYHFRKKKKKKGNIISFNTVLRRVSGNVVMSYPSF